MIRPSDGASIEALSGRNDRQQADGAAGSAAWYRGVGELIEDLGGSGGELPARLVAALNLLVPFELAAMFAYRGRTRPLVVYDNFQPGEAKKGIATYVENTYVLNPFYRAWLKGLPDGVYRIRELAPDAYFESEYYRRYRVVPRPSEEIGYVTEHWPEGLEEIDVCLTVEAGVVVELSIYRSLRNRGFGDDELARIETVIPVLRAFMRRYWAALDDAGLRAHPPDSRVDDAFADFGRDLLSGREREVARLILRGHSSESIAFNLGISLGTVKTHRKNAYAKLRISSQSELLSLFLRSLRNS